MKGWHRLGVLLAIVPAICFVVQLVQHPGSSDTWAFAIAALVLYAGCIGIGWVVDGFKSK